VTDRRRAAALRAVAALAILVLAFGLRWRALERLPIDYEEPWTFAAVAELTELLRSGELGRLTETNPTPEHPQLGKLVLATAMLPAAESAPSPRRGSVFLNHPGLPEQQLLAARTASAVAGSLEALLLALVSPLAGLFLAVHTYTVKFTSHAQIEALPALLSLASVLGYLRFKRTGRSGWLALSSVLLGLTAAAKYVYGIVGLVILLDHALELRTTSGSWRSRTGPALLWGAGSLLVFFAATPFFWPDPVGRLQASLLFLADFSTESREVREAAFPWWQPLAWLSFYIPNDAPDARPYLVRIDPMITLLALLGLARTWRKERLWVLWLGTVLAFLLLWNTKWPYYVLMLTAPLCVAAAEGAWQLQSWLARPLGRSSQAA
jgi:hypothetical protein